MYRKGFNKGTVARLLVESREYDSKCVNWSDDGPGDIPAGSYVGVVGSKKVMGTILARVVGYGPWDKTKVMALVSYDDLEALPPLEQLAVSEELPWP